MADRNTPKANTSAKSPNKTLNDDAEAPLPSVNERLAQLRPSRELLEYYRLKMAEFDDEYDALTERLEQYKCTYEDQVRGMQLYHATRNLISTPTPRGVRDLLV